MEHKSGCLICGAELAYSEVTSALVCYYCGATNNANASCIHGHYVCDQCHGCSANDLIERYCAQTSSTNPVAIALQLMKSPAIKMHGPEHHFMVPAALLAAYGNQVSQAARETAGQLAQARSRAEAVSGGFCGFQGACGAAIGTGIFVSVVTKATPLSKHEWQLSNRMTAQSLGVIAEHGGPRCCKRGTFWALLTAVEYMRKHFNAKWYIEQPVVCTFSAMNRECLRQECQFYRS